MSRARAQGLLTRLEAILQQTRAVAALEQALAEAFSQWPDATLPQAAIELLVNRLASSETLAEALDCLGYGAPPSAEDLRGAPALEREIQQLGRCIAGRYESVEADVSRAIGAECDRLGRAQELDALRIRVETAMDEDGTREEMYTDYRNWRLGKDYSFQSETARFRSWLTAHAAVVSRSNRGGAAEMAVDGHLFVTRGPNGLGIRLQLEPFDVDELFD